MATPPHALSLRSDLKQFEAEFFENNGRKPSREDIKKLPAIAAKYKEYNEFRDPRPSKSSRPQTAKESPPKSQSQYETPKKPRPGRKTNTASASQSFNIDDDPFSTPSNNRSQKKATLGSQRSTRSNRDPLQTPTNPNRIIGGPVDHYDSPISARKLRFSHTGSIGPTPQKTGRVLGLFESMIDQATPPRPSSARKVVISPSSKPSNTEIVQQANSPFETPRKRKFDPTGDNDSPSVARSGASTIAHTPSTLADGETPKKRRVPSEDLFATPSFLRRSSSKIYESSLDPSPIGKRMLGRGLVKGLSSLMADLRKAQDDKLDEEMELMREMEAEAEGRGPEPVQKKALFPAAENGATPAIPLPTVPEPSHVFGTDTDVKLIPENGELESSDDDEENEYGDKPFTRTWKKKGLKRQTRRVKMKPVKNKPSAPDTTAAELSDVEEEDEAQAQDDVPSGEDEVSNFSGSDNDDSENPKKSSKAIGRLVKKKTTTTVTQKKVSTTRATVAKGKKGVATAVEGEEEKKEKAPVKKGKRAATTGANFRKLNIRTQGGMKGRGRGGGRFNRRR